ncbi:MAG TPA: carbonic anhydrase [Gammaproteobacteria bacterium]|nr:carbonic anhydrase [Gammaproteobacteria bacterium]
MGKSFNKVLQGYQTFRKKYVLGDQSIMQYLSHYGQQPKVMVVACCDSRVDPALILQCDPGDLFVVRNVANIIPPYEKDEAHHGTSAALEFGIRFLEVEELILLGHSQCGGIQALLNSRDTNNNDFINNWVSLIKAQDYSSHDVDVCAKSALHQSYQNCLTFPWLVEKVNEKKLNIHLWFFDIKMGKIFTYSNIQKEYQSLENLPLADEF